MSQTAADRQALMTAIKRELKQRLWDDPRDEQAYGSHLALFVLNPEPVWVYHAKSLRVLDVNKAAVERYGYARDEFSTSPSKTCGRKWTSQNSWS